MGRTFCNLRNDFRTHFYDKIKIVKKTRAFKYYDMFYDHFNIIAIQLDNLILNYYPDSVSYIDGISIFDVFFNIHDNSDSNIKTNVELKKDLEYFISILQEKLDIKTIEYRKIQRYLKLILKKLDKAIDKGFID
jgi:hypothetical protein